MQITGKVINAANGQPVPYASATIVDRNGNYLKAGVAANASGNFKIASELLQLPNFLMITSAGYKPGYVNPISVRGPVTIPLQESGKMEEVVITAKKKSYTYTGWILLGLLLIAAKR